MLRKAVCAVAVFAFSVGLVLAAEIRGVITKVSDDGKTITVGKFDRETKMITDEKEYKVSADVKVLKGKFNKETKALEAGDPLAEGLKNKMFTNAKRGVRATITTDDSGNVTQIVVMQGGKRKRD